MRSTMLVFTIALLLPLSSRAADNLRIDQVSPDAHTWITATVVPWWCGFENPKVAVGDNRVSITVDMDGGSVCIATWVPIPVKVDIGTLPPGTYVVSLSGTAVSASAITLVVRGIEPIQATPFGGPTGGGNLVILSADVDDFEFSGLDLLRSVTFGGERATIKSSGVTGASVIAPPHAAGDVDVTLTMSLPPPDSGEQTFTARAAYRYFDPAAPPDPFLFEPLLYPIAFHGSGAYGSTWTTENLLSVRPSSFASLWRPPCASCSTVLDGWKEPVVPLTLDPVSRDSGVVLYVDRSSSDSLAASSHIRDLSRQALSAGVEIPVVRERDFRPYAMFFPIPTDARFRAMLRVWSLEDVSGRINVQVAANGESLESVPLQLSRSSAEALSFASVDLTPLLQRYSAYGTILLRLSTQRLWGMVSITNNSTQEVTIVTPH